VQPVNIVLYDESGNEILVSAIEACKGMNQLHVSTAGVSKGIYICRVMVCDEWFSGKVYVN
jgi:hypothetical protein